MTPNGTFFVNKWSKGTDVGLVSQALGSGWSVSFVWTSQSSQKQRKKKNVYEGHPSVSNFIVCY